MLNDLEYELYLTHPRNIVHACGSIERHKRGAGFYTKHIVPFFFLSLYISFIHGFSPFHAQRDTVSIH